MRRFVMAAVILSSCGMGDREVVEDGDCPGGAGQSATQIVENAQEGCTVDGDCTVVNIDLSCFEGGFEPVLASKLASVEQQLHDLDDRVCPGKTCKGDVGGGDPSELACVTGTCTFAPPDAGLAIPQGFAGYFHEVGIPEALNLELLSNGRYSAMLYGCNVQEGFGGTWFQNGTEPFMLTFSHGSTDTTVRVGDGGVLFSDNPLFFDDGGLDALAPGAVCAVCDGGGGPTVLVPCDTPFGF